MTKIFLSEAGDRCDSDFEVIIVNDLLERGVPYEFHPGPFEYSRLVRSGFCLDCDSNNVRKGALYTPDLYLPGPELYIELKGGSTTQASRGRLRDFIKHGEVKLCFIFRDDRKIRGTKARHRQWAERQGCTTHIGLEVPESWLKLKE